MLVVYISFGNLSIIVRENNCLEYSNKEGPSLKSRRRGNVVKPALVLKALHGCEHIYWPKKVVLPLIPDFLQAGMCSLTCFDAEIPANL